MTYLFWKVHGQPGKDPDRHGPRVMPAKEMALLDPIEDVHDGGVGRLDDVVVDDEPVVVQDDRVRRALQPLQCLVDVGRDSHHRLAVLVRQSVVHILVLEANVDPRHGRLY